MKHPFALCLVTGLALTCALAQTARADYQNPAFDRGTARMRAGDFDGAVNSFGEAIGMNSTEPKGYLMRGECFYKLQNYKLAIQDMDKTLQLAPDNVRAYLVRGSCKANLGQDDDAVADYLAAIKLQPSLGKRYFENGGPNVSAAAQANNTAGDGSGKKRRRGRVVNQNGKATIEAVDQTDSHADLRLHAVEDYKKAMAIAYPSGFGQVKTSEGTAVPGSGEFEGDAHKAIADLNELIRNGNATGANYYKRAKALQKLGRVDDSLKDYERAISLDPQKSQYYIGRASLFFQLKKPLMVEAEIARARAVDPDVPAKVHFDLPRYDDSVKWSAGDGPDNH